MIDEGWMAAVVLLLLGIAVAAAAAAINLWRIADALEGEFVRQHQDTPRDGL